MAWRPDVEKTVLNAANEGIKSIVVRPGLVYGQGTKRIVGWEPKAAKIDEELSKNVKAFASAKG